MDSSHNHVVPKTWARALIEGREPTWAPLACGAIAIAAWSGSHWGWPQAFVFGLWLASYVFGGLYSLARALRNLAHGRLDIDLLMLVSATGAALIGEIAEGATLLFLFSLANALEARALRRTTGEIEALMDLRPDRASRLGADGAETMVAIDDLVIDDRVRVRPGERMPVDGRIDEGHTSVDQAAITGESMPEQKSLGDQVFAGSINVGGTVDLVVERPASDSTLARIIRLVESAREAKAPTQRFIDRFEQGYAALVLAGAALMILIPLALGNPFRETAYLAMTLLVVASPCAVVIATPATVLTALAHAARRGLLFKGGAPLEDLASLDAMAFDKTGTLTEGKPSVSQITPFGDADADTLLALAAAVERLSEHHLGQAIIEEAERRHLDLPIAENLLNTRGQGVTARIGTVPVAIGRRDFAFDTVAYSPRADSEPLFARLDVEAKTIIYIATPEIAGAVAIEDRVRPEAKSIVADLHRLGVRDTVLLTGDSAPIGEKVATEVGVANWRAGLMPEDKVAALRERVSSGQRIAMVGDGANDAPALATATVGIAMGLAGTDAALETADLVLVRDDLSGLAYAVRLARRARRIVRQNLIFACSVILVLVVVTLVSGLALPLGVVGHEGSTLLVILNGLRALRPLPSIDP